MDPLTISACGYKNWDWPCIELEGGDLVDLSISWLNDGGSDYELPSVGTDDDVTITFMYRPIDRTMSSPRAGTATATVSGDTVTVSDFDPSDLYGIYAAAVRWTDNDAGKSHLTLNCILSVGTDMFGGNRSNQALTMQDIRMVLFDRLASENKADEGQEFSNRAIYEGVAHCIQLFRDTAYDYSASANANSFPNRRLLAMGAAGWTLRSYKNLLARNANSVGGQTNIESGRLQAYASIGDRMYSAFLSWASEYLHNEDVDDGYDIV